MDCGATDYTCLILAWLKENDFAAAVVTKLLGQSAEDAAGVLGWIAGFLSTQIDKIIASAGVAFGVYRWWIYREHILHKRLSEYLQENDRRLAGALDDVLRALQRPGPGQIPKLPLFAPRELLSVLRERNWDRERIAATVMSSASAQLTKAMDKIARQMKSGDDKTSILRHQLATAHIIQGAISTASAPRSQNAAQELEIDALRSFRSALQVPGHELNLIAKEFEAHQLRKLGHLPQALSAYEHVQTLATTVGDYRTQRLIIARAMRYQAEILQSQEIKLLANGERQFGKCVAAYKLLGPNSKNSSALTIRSNFAPYKSWELLEQGDMHYLTAFVARNAEFPNIEPEQLDAAETAYQGILAEPSRAFFGRRGAKQLRAQATAGLDRVRRARIEQIYDVRWLMPKSGG